MSAPGLPFVEARLDVGAGERRRRMADCAADSFIEQHYPGPRRLLIVHDGPSLRHPHNWPPIVTEYTAQEAWDREHDPEPYWTTVLGAECWWGPDRLASQMVQARESEEQVTKLRRALFCDLSSQVAYVLENATHGISGTELYPPSWTPGDKLPVVVVDNPPEVYVSFVYGFGDTHKTSASHRNLLKNLFDKYKTR